MFTFSREGVVAKDKKRWLEDINEENIPVDIDQSDDTDEDTDDIKELIKNISDLLITLKEVFKTLSTLMSQQTSPNLPVQE